MNALLIALIGLALSFSTVSAAVPAPRVPGVDLAEGISQITGVAVSPLLGVSASGAWRYYHTPTQYRGALPWYCRPEIWGTCFALLAACFLKDAFGTVVPGVLKKPFDMMELFESKLSALVASTAFVPLVMAEMARHQNQTTAQLFVQDAHHPVALAVFNMSLLYIPLGVAAFMVVWMTGHAVNVLVALCPFGAVGTVLKLLKTTVLVAIVGTAFLNPFLGAGFALLIIGLAAFLAGPAFRLTVFGTVLAVDTMLPWRAKRVATPDAPHVFTAHGVPGVPARTFGRLKRDTDGVVFCYRPWLVLAPQEVSLPSGQFVMAKGVWYPSLLVSAGSSNSCHTMLNFPPRYRGCEQVIATHFEIHEIRESVLNRGLKAIRAWFTEVLHSGKTTIGKLSHSA